MRGGHLGGTLSGVGVHEVFWGGGGHETLGLQQGPLCPSMSQCAPGPPTGVLSPVPVPHCHHLSAPTVLTSFIPVHTLSPFPVLPGLHWSYRVIPVVSLLVPMS